MSNGYRWLMRIKGPMLLTSPDIYDILEPTFTTVEFRTIYNAQKDQLEYQYKPFDKWETYYVASRQLYSDVASWVMVVEHLLPHSHQERYYKVERVYKTTQT